AGEVERQPRLAERLPAVVHGGLQPGVPGLDERARQPRHHEIALGRHLAVEAGARPAIAGAQREGGHRNSSSSRRVNGLTTLFARSSKVALRSPMTKVSRNRSSEGAPST